MMTRDLFKLIHSELIMQVQLIENDLIGLGRNSNTGIDESFIAITRHSMVMISNA